MAKSLWVADKLALEPVQIIQPQYNLLYREEEREMLPLCADQNIAAAPWSPLAQGVLTGRYTKENKPDSPRVGGDEIRHWFLRDQDFAIIDRLVEVANEKRATPAQIALAWIFTNDVISTPIVGISKMAHLEQAVEAVDIELTNEEVDYLEELYQPRALIGHYGGSLQLATFSSWFQELSP